jgi:hypothetical protein
LTSSSGKPIRELFRIPAHGRAQALERHPIDQLVIPKSAEQIVRTLEWHVSEKVDDLRDMHKLRLNSSLPIPNRRLRHPDLGRNLPLEHSQVHPALPDVLSEGFWLQNIAFWVYSQRQ